MEQKYLIYLLGFEVKLQDRRTGKIESGFIIMPFPGEYPDDIEDANKVTRYNANNAIKNHYDRLGYNIQEIKHKDSKVKEIDLKAEYEAAPTTAEYAE